MRVPVNKGEPPPFLFRAWCRVSIGISSNAAFGFWENWCGRRGSQSLSSNCLELRTCENLSAVSDYEGRASFKLRVKCRPYTLVHLCLWFFDAGQVVVSLKHVPRGQGKRGEMS